MKTKFPFRAVLILFITSLFFNCSKDEIIPGDVEINNFIWGGMNAYYKWQGEVDDLADTNFSTRAQLNEYLEGFNGSEDVTAEEELFHSLLYTAQDNSSFITEDYEIIEDAFEGKKATTGMKVYLREFKDSSDLYAYVYDVVAGSEAEALGITRGMIITEVNGTSLTLNNVEGIFESNSISFFEADYNDGNPEIPFDDPTITSDDAILYTLTKSVIPENPIKISTTLDVGGQKIGYLMYNNFTPAYDGELNNVFASFRTASLDNLIIDLRYNGGGSIETATYLASMITGQFKDEVFSKQIWNDKVMSNVINQNRTDFFTDEIDNGVINETINSLGLSTVYFIVSDATANTAELLINGLKAHLVDGVKLIGIQTLGLTEASLTIYDSDDYTKSGENFNTNHTWAMQPIVLEVQNSLNTNEVGVGHVVDVTIEEDAGDLGIIGGTTDPVLSHTIDYITTGVIISNVTESKNVNLWNSNSLFLDYNKMYTTLSN